MFACGSSRSLPGRLSRFGIAAFLGSAFLANAQNPVVDLHGTPGPPVRVTPSQPLQTITLSSTAWTFIGPGPQSSGNVNSSVSGRITGIAADPTDSNTIYIATAGGGVWKTTNATSAGTGLTWTPLTDTQSTLSMGAIAVAPLNHLVVYAGTGEANNNTLDSNYGRGILVSTDGGATWTLRQGPGNVFNRMATSAIAVDPTNANIAYAAMVGGDHVENGLQGTPGIYKTTDGGATWANTTAAIDITSAYSDVKVDLTVPTNVYMAIGNIFGGATNGVYKSTNGGTTWSRLTNAPSGSDEDVGRISLAVGKPTVLYATVSCTDPFDPGNFCYENSFSTYKVVHSGDGGASFNDVTPSNYMGSQGWYDQTVIVDPSNANIVYVAGAAGPNSILRSATGGAVWTDISQGGAPSNTSPHGDHHALAVDKNGLLLDGNDGGIYRLDNPATPSWSDLNGNLGTIKFHGIGLHPTDRNRVLGGSQGNGTALYTGTTTWTQTDGGDGGPAKFSQTNGSRAYHIAPWVTFGPSNFFRRSDDGGVSWTGKTTGIPAGDNNESLDSFPPFIVDGANGDHLLLGVSQLYETTNAGDLWTPITTLGAKGWPTSFDPLTAIGLAPSDGNTIYASTAASHVFVTTNHGSTWIDHPLPVSGYISDLEVDSTSAITAFAVISQFTNGGNVFKTTNGGASWINISGNLPSEPVWSIREDTGGVLYVGADDGVYISTNGGNTWSRMGTGLPNAQVFQLALNKTLHILGAATHGRSAWEISTIPLSCNPVGSSTPTAPSGGVTGNLPTFSWSAATNADTYYIALFKTADVLTSLSPVPQILGPTANTSFTPSTMIANGDYLWGVVPINACGTTGPVQRLVLFTLNATCPLAAPKLSAPANGGLVFNPATFSWSSVPSATIYRPIIVSSGGQVLFSPLVSGTTYTPTHLATGSDAWAAVAWNSTCGVSPLSSVNAFSVLF